MTLAFALWLASCVHAAPAPEPAEPLPNPRSACEARLAARTTEGEGGCPICPCACNDDGSLNCAPCALCTPNFTKDVESPADQPPP